MLSRRLLNSLAFMTAVSGGALTLYWGGIAWVVVLATGAAAWGYANANKSLSVHIVPVWQRHITSAREHFTESVDELVQCFSNINHHLEQVLDKEELKSAQVLHHTEKIHQDLERILVGLQSQDRVSQMLTSVTDDMQRFTCWLENRNDPAAIHPKLWLKRLENSYTMEDQFFSHHNTAATQRSSTVDFF